MEEIDCGYTQSSSIQMQLHISGRLVVCNSIYVSSFFNTVLCFTEVAYSFYPYSFKIFVAAIAELLDNAVDEVVYTSYLHIDLLFLDV